MSVTTRQVTVTTTVVALAWANDGATVEATIRNDHATVSLFIGDAAVTSGTGYEIPAQGELALTLGSGERIYGVAASGTVPVQVLETIADVEPAYFTLAEIRARFTQLTSTSDEILEYWRDYVEERIETACDVAFVTRTVTSRVLSGDGSTRLEMPNNRVQSISAATDAGTAVDIADAVADSGSFYLPAGWGSGTSNLTVTFTHGYTAVPLAVKEAAMLWVRELALKGPVTDRATQIPTESGGAINLATPGLFGSISGLPAVDEVLSEYRYPSFVG